MSGPSSRAPSPAPAEVSRTTTTRERRRRRQEVVIVFDHGQKGHHLDPDMWRPKVTVFCASFSIVSSLLGEVFGTLCGAELPYLNPILLCTHTQTRNVVLLCGMYSIGSHTNQDESLRWTTTGSSEVLLLVVVGGGGDANDNRNEIARDFLRPCKQ